MTKSYICIDRKILISVCECETTFVCKDCRLEDAYLYFKSFGNWKKKSISADFAKSYKLVAHTLWTN